MIRKLPIDLAVALSSIPDQEARKVLVGTVQNLQDQDWSRVHTMGIREAMNEKYVGKPIKIHAAVSYLSDPTPAELRRQSGRITIINFGLIDSSDNDIRCAAITYHKFGDKLQKCLVRRAFYIFQGIILSVIDRTQTGPSRYYMFYLEDIDEDLTAIDLIKSPPKQIARAYELIAKYGSTPGGVFGYIKKMLIKNLNIKGLNNAAHLNKCIDFMIYQSLSEGIYDKKSMKLHSLVIGAPGEGKKLLTIIASILNPVFEEVPPVKLTNAGLIGRAVVSGRITSSIPGYLPRASGGTLGIQDLHELIGNKGREVKATFAQAMEDGVVIDATSAKTRHEATTSVHADTNKLSQILLTDIPDISSDINLRTNLLSRFDGIFDIPPDKDREFETMKSMLKNVGEIRTSREPASNPRWQISLRTIIAVLRTEFRVITISDVAVKYILMLVEKMRDDGKFETIPSGMMTRIANSITKLTVVSARINLRRRVCQRDIDTALGFIEDKLEFLSKLNPERLTENPDMTAKERRHDLIRTCFRGQTVSRKQVHDLIVNGDLDSVCVKTISRDLEALGQPKGRDQWLIQ